jgi:D-alanyl-D-alanine carboxypeptidase
MTASSSATGQHPGYAVQLREQIPQLMKEHVIPGSVVLVRSRDEGDWSATFGTREIGKSLPLSLEDHFRVGSNTKTMTSTVILQLVQEGLLGLDDVVSAHWPDVPNGDAITIAQLSEMRSGLYSYTFDREFNETLDLEPQKAWAPEELLAIAFSHPPNFEPGARFDYCNTNTVLLGVIIEKLTRMSASDAFRERIFEPLGLTHTSLPDRTDSSIPDPHPEGYAFGSNVSTIDTFALPQAEQADAKAGLLKPNNETNANPSWAWTAGGAISTAGDLATYVKALVGGGLLDEPTQRIRLRSIQPTDPSTPGAAGYGLGLARFGPSVMGHDGQLPGFMTFMGYDPQLENTIIVATNLAATPEGEGSALVLAKGIIATLYGASSVPDDSPAGPPSQRP